jgi:hypothetical protein
MGAAPTTKTRSGSPLHEIFTSNLKELASPVLRIISLYTSIPWRVMGNVYLYRRYIRHSDSNVFYKGIKEENISLFSPTTLLYIGLVAT